MKLIFCLLILCLYSCSTTKAVAPELEEILVKNGVHAGGRVVYNPHGLESWVKKRRAEALLRMEEVCGKNQIYKIVKEKTVQPGEINPKYQGNAQLLAGSSVRMIEYRCYKK